MDVGNEEFTIGIKPFLHLQHLETHKSSMTLQSILALSLHHSLPATRLPFDMFHNIPDAGHLDNLWDVKKIFEVSDGYL